MPVKIRLTLLLILAPIIAAGHDQEQKSRSLLFDQPIADELPIQFQSEEDIHPSKSEFKIVGHAFLSNEIGERWAMAIVENLSPDSRTFTEDQLIGFFADGQHRNPIRLRRRIEGLKVDTFLIPFGKSDAPLVKLMTRGF